MLRSYLICFVFTAATSAETLHYTINWQSGLSLGEAVLNATHVQAAEGEGSTTAGWQFDAMLDVSVPGFLIREEYKSTADAQLCATELKKTSTRGQRKNEEEIKFDQAAMTVTRQILNGGPKGTQSMPVCGHDALSYLQFVRQELAQGRLPPQQPVVLGAKYETHLTFVGTETIKLGDKRIEADKVRVSIKGPKADHLIELYFSRDAARTPVLARLPLTLGTFTVELLP